MFNLANIGELAQQAQELKVKTESTVEEFREKLSRIEARIDQQFYSLNTRLDTIVKILYENRKGN
jgi:hypothetical protein